MARYFNPADELPKVGRQLAFPALWSNLQAQLQPGEVLVGLYDRLIYKAAPYLDQYQLTSFEDSYNQGQFIGRQFYAVPKDEAEAHDRPLF